jgi:hypothetical protein
MNTYEIIIWAMGIKMHTGRVQFKTARDAEFYSLGLLHATPNATGREVRKLPT